jgi:hypothetical protein
VIGIFLALQLSQEDHEKRPSTLFECRHGHLLPNQVMKFDSFHNLKLFDSLSLKMSFYLQVRGNGATNIHPPEFDNPGSCVADDPLIMGIDDYQDRKSVSVNHLGIRCGHVRTGAHESLALEAVLYDYVDSVKCITDSDRGYHSSAIAGFTIEVTLKADASEHLGVLIKAKEDEDAIAEQRKKSKGTKISSKATSNKKTCIKNIVKK